VEDGLQGVSGSTGGIPQAEYLQVMARGGETLPCHVHVVNCPVNALFVLVKVHSESPITRLFFVGKRQP